MQRAQQPTSALYVRLPAAEAAKLDRAAQALGMAKKDLVTGLVANYVDPDSGVSLTALGQAVRRHHKGPEMPEPQTVVGRVTFSERISNPLDVTKAQPAIGRVTFSERIFPEVLNSEQVAGFLQTSTAAVVEMATRGEIPGRQIAGEWRFSRQAIIRWLGPIPAE